MLSRRIIPCLDVTNGRVVKGVKFKELRDAGDPVECAKAYDAQGADELVFLDITASSDGRSIMHEVVARTAEQCFMPLTVGGGLRSVDDIEAMLKSGADKVSLNTAAIKNPQLIADSSRRFGNQCIVLAIDAKDCDGMLTGYDVALTRAVSDAVSVPVIASGGAGQMEHFADVLDAGRASAVLAASLFHFGTFTIPQVKDYLATHNVPVRR